MNNLNPLYEMRVTSKEQIMRLQKALKNSKPSTPSIGRITTLEQIKGFQKSLENGETPIQHSIGRIWMPKKVK